MVCCCFVGVGALCVALICVVCVVVLRLCDDCCFVLIGFAISDCIAVFVKFDDSLRWCAPICVDSLRVVMLCVAVDCGVDCCWMSRCLVMMMLMFDV